MRIPIDHGDGRDVSQDHDDDQGEEHLRRGTVLEHLSGYERSALGLVGLDALLQRGPVENAQLFLAWSRTTSLMMSTTRATIPPTTTTPSPTAPSVQLPSGIARPPTRKPMKITATATQELGRPP